MLSTHHVYRVVGVLTFSFIASLVGAGLWIQRQFSVPTIQAEIVRWGDERLGRRVSVEAIRVTWSGRLIIDKPRLAGSTGKPGPFLAERIEADYSIPSLLRGGQEVQDIRVFGPQLTLVVREDGTSDLDDVRDRWFASAVGPQSPLPECSVQDGSIRVQDGKGLPSLQLTNLVVKTRRVDGGDLSIEAAGKANQIPIEVSAAFEQAGQRFQVQSFSAQKSGVEFRAEDAVLTFRDGGALLAVNQAKIDSSPFHGEFTLDGGVLQGTAVLTGLNLASVQEEAVGMVDLDVEVSGSLVHPKFEGKSRLHGVSFPVGILGTWKETVKLADAEVRFDGEHIEMPSTQGWIRKVPFEVSGEISQLSASPRLDVEAVGRLDSIEPFLDSLPDTWRSLDPVLSADIHLSAKGELRNTDVRIEVRPRGGTLQLPGERVVNILPGGALSISNSTLEIQEMPLKIGPLAVKISSEGHGVSGELEIRTAVASWGHSHLDLVGSVRFPSPSLGDTPFRADLDLTDLPGGSANSGTASVTGQLRGDWTDPHFTGEITCPEVQLRGASDLVMKVREITATFGGSATEVQLTRLSGQVAGGHLTGSVSAVRDLPIHLDLALEATSLTRLIQDLGATAEGATGTVGLEFEGDYGTKGLVGAGTARCPDLVVDASHSAALASGRKMVQGGKVAGGALALVLGTNPIGMLVLAGAAQASFYSRVVEELSRPHSLQGVKVSFKVAGGKVEIETLDGADLTGNLIVDQGSQTLAGTIAFVRLGDVEIRGLKITGSVSDPTTVVDLSMLSMKGQSAPVEGISSAGTGVGGVVESLGDGIMSVPEGVVDAIGGLLGGKSRRKTSGKSRVGGILGGLFR